MSGDRARCRQAEYVGFNRHTVLSLHALLADNLPDPRACGRVRAHGVGITDSTFHPLEIPQLIDECFGRILGTAAAIEDPFRLRYRELVADCVRDVVTHAGYVRIRHGIRATLNPCIRRR